LFCHLLLNHEGIAGALIVAVFWFVLFSHYRQYLFRDLYRKGYICVVTANACEFARSPKPFCADLRR